MENLIIKQQKVIVLLQCACTGAVGGADTSHTALENPAPSDCQLACPACGGGEQERTGGDEGRDEKARRRKTRHLRA